MTGEASLLFPLIVSQTFAKVVHEQKKTAAAAGAGTAASSSSSAAPLAAKVAPAPTASDSKQPMGNGLNGSTHEHK